MTAPAYWTEADQAEADVLVRELVDGVLEHRDRCRVCQADYPPCPRVTAAIEAVVAWRDHRMLDSRRVWLVASEVARLEELRRRAEAVLGEAA